MGRGLQGTRERRLLILTAHFVHASLVAYGDGSRGIRGTHTRARGDDSSSQWPPQRERLSVGSFHTGRVHATRRNVRLTASTVPTVQGLRDSRGLEYFVLRVVRTEIGRGWYLVIMRIIAYYQGMLIGFVAGLVFAYVRSVLRKK